MKRKEGRSKNNNREIDFDPRLTLAASRPEPDERLDWLDSLLFNP